MKPRLHNHSRLDTELLVALCGEAARLYHTTGRPFVMVTRGGHSVTSSAQPHARWIDVRRRSCMQRIACDGIIVLQPRPERADHGWCPSWTSADAAATTHRLWRTVMHEYGHVKDHQIQCQCTTVGTDGRRRRWANRPMEQRAEVLRSEAQSRADARTAAFIWALALDCQRVINGTLQRQWR